MIRFAPLSKPAHKPVTCIRSVTDRMAETMREMAFAGENVNVESLKSRGFSEAVIQRCHAHAVSIARRRSIRHVDAN